ncbi:F-box only protein 39-like [Haliotis rufescens]|uniref:F-box only protein 39-like n=1 Tax=Haliotis rufescens TaxID=6454 RepID=UPI001EB0896D|nr:F-box only protein 39-like [Haliotis rufescens]
MLWGLPMDLQWLRNVKRWITSSLWGTMESSTWVYLPDTALIEIYCHLHDQDRANMALVCRSWLRAFHAPCLWRHRSVELGGYRAVISGVRACSFADQHGKYLRHLILYCNHPSNHTSKVVQKNIDSFLQKIQDCRLVSFDLERLELDRFWKFDHLREKVVESLCRFFRSQRHIEEFDMSSAQCSLTNGCKLLESLGNSSGHVLKTLGIEDFFHTRLAIYQVKRFKHTMGTFTALQDLSINYSCLSEDILHILNKNLAGKLTRILIKVYKPDPHFHRISGRTWKLLKTSCPDLTVEVWFESIGMSSEVIPILVPEMPLQDMHMWSGYDDDTDWNLSETLNYLGVHHKKTLQSLSLELDNNQEYVDDILVRMLSRCTCLHELTINAVLHVFTIEAICEMIQENKIFLQVLHVTVCGLTDTEWAELSYLREKFTPMLKERHVDFKLQSDLMIDS